MRNPSGSTVKTAEFKARLSHYLREVRAGRVLTVMDRSTPVAFVSPADRRREETLIVRKASRKWSDVKLPPPLRTRVDIVKLLLEDRESGR